MGSRKRCIWRRHPSLQGNQIVYTLKCDDPKTNEDNAKRTRLLLLPMQPWETFKLHSVKQHLFEILSTATIFFSAQLKQLCIFKTNSLRAAADSPGTSTSCNDARIMYSAVRVHRTPRPLTYW